MALLAEEIVEEWLNRQGYFTIRGIKVGVHEIDLLAVKYHKDGEPECRHIEVQASMRPVSYISRVPKKEQKNGRAKNSAKRSDEELGLSGFLCVRRLGDLASGQFLDCLQAPARPPKAPRLSHAVMVQPLTCQPAPAA